MDRVSIDFERLARLNDASSFFVSRAKSNFRAKRRYSRAVDRATGLVCDQIVVLSGFYSREGYKAPLRPIKFNDPETGKRLVFLAKNFALPALGYTGYAGVSNGVKQDLRIKAFFGTTENAVKTHSIARSVTLLAFAFNAATTLSSAPANAYGTSRLLHSGRRISGLQHLHVRQLYAVAWHQLRDATSPA
jgi:hypothetical protein